jgi:hypothetical protein
MNKDTDYILNILNDKLKCSMCKSFFYRDELIDKYPLIVNTRSLLCKKCNTDRGVQRFNEYLTEPFNPYLNHAIKQG